MSILYFVLLYMLNIIQRLLDFVTVITVVLMDLSCNTAAPSCVCNSLITVDLSYGAIMVAK